MSSNGHRARAVMVGLGGTILGSRPVSFTFSRLVPGLRVLAYHDVPDPHAFRAHLAEIRRNYRPVSAEEVVAATARGRRLPRRALWVTFDDGNPGTFRAAADLAAAGVSATAFVCPGVVDTREPLWWQVVDEAIRRDVLPTGMNGGDLVRFRSSLKTVSDRARRRAVDACREALNAQVPGGFQVAQATTGDLGAWLNHGHHVGNHTWDHPLLNRCPEEEQKRQIATAHEWLRERFPTQPTVFAYPNGSRTAYAEGIAASLGYQVRTLFDHRIAASDLGAQAVSRVRIDTDAPLARFRAIASGAHPLTFALSHR